MPEPFFNTFDFDKYLNYLTRGDCFLNDLVRSKLVNRVTIQGNIRVHRDKALDMIRFFNYSFRDRDRLHMEYNPHLDEVWVEISFKLAVDFLKNPEKIFGKGTQPHYAFEFNGFLRDLERYVSEQTSSFVKKKEQERLELERKKEQEQLELERKKEQEQLELEHKRKQKQLEKEKEGNEKKLKQNKIDTIVSYFFNRNLN